MERVSNDGIRVIVDNMEDKQLNMVGTRSTNVGNKNAQTDSAVEVRRKKKAGKTKKKLTEWY